MLRRRGDHAKRLHTVVGLVVLFVGLGLLVWHRHWEPLVPIIVGAALIDRSTIVDLVRAWKGRREG